MTSGFSKYDRIETTQSLYCYPGTDILKNKAGITDSKALAEFEADVTAFRQYMLENNPIKGKFGLTHISNIHKFIFQDIYPFAGKLRLEDIWKGDTFFCKNRYIKSNLDSLFIKLAKEKCLRRLEVDAFTKRAAYYMSELNIIHPFREGNGRTIREFIRCLALENNFDIDWSLVDSGELLKASIIAVNDKLEPLEKCLRMTITTKNSQDK